MPEYRVVKKPSALTSSPLTSDEKDLVVGGNEAAIGTDIADGKHATQLDVWYPSGKTIVAAKLNGKTIASWSFKGRVSPEDCREWYLASVQSGASV